MLRKLPTGKINAHGQRSFPWELLLPLMRHGAGFPQYPSSNEIYQSCLFSHLHKLVGIDQFRIGSSPPDERLESHDFSGPELYNRLVMKHKFAVLQCSVEISLDLQSVHPERVNAFVIND